MRYLPRLTEKEIKENHRRFAQRASVYRNRDFDFMASRLSILGYAGRLEGKILEIGSGTGHMSLALAQRGYRFTSIDVDKKALRISAMNLAYEGHLDKAELFVMDGNRLTFGDESFNNIIAVNFFHHITDAGRILKEMDRVLAQGGKMLLADFNELGASIVDDVHKKEGHIHDHSGLSRERITACLDEMSYETESRDEKYHWVLLGQKARQDFD